jgi:outer membrane murein-binding lipoprotein Lpp
MEKLLQELLTEVKGIKVDLAEVKSDVKELKTDVATLKTDVNVLKTDVATLKTDVNVLKTDVDGLKSDVTSLKSEVVQLRQDMDLGFAQVNHKLDTIYTQVVHNTEQEVVVSEITVKVAEHDADIKLIKRVLADKLA